MVAIEVWADVRCPWCWIVSRRLLRVAERSHHEVRVRRRSFLLEPAGPETAGKPIAEEAMATWGMSARQWDAKRSLIQSQARSEGLEIALDTALTFDSRPLHRLLKLVAEAGESSPDAAWDAAFAAHFHDNADLNDPAVLKSLAISWGIDPHQAERAVSGQTHTQAVLADIAEAQRLNITSVPTLIATSGRRLVGNVSTARLDEFLTSEGAEQ